MKRSPLEQPLLARHALAVAIAAALVLPAAAAAGTTAPYTAKRTSACLTARHVLVTAGNLKQDLPKGITAAAELEVGFALLPAEATDQATIFFARSAAAAPRLAASLIADSIKQASYVQGINQADARKRIVAAYAVHGNAVVVWGVEHPKAASRRLVAACLK